MRVLFPLITLIITFSSYSQIESYNLLLEKHINPNTGSIDYKSLKKDYKLLDTYLDFLSKTTPDETWSIDKKKSFWLNAYNAYTFKIIIDNYPFKKTSIDKNKDDKQNNDLHSLEVTINYTYKESSLLSINKNGKNAWEIPFANINGKLYTLNHIEHEIIRKKFKDPRIHAGLNAAAISGPNLISVAYTEENVNDKLNILMKTYINDASKNKITPSKVKVSKIFEWYKDDFTQNNTSLIQYLNKFSDIIINKNAEVKYMEYNWVLNDI